MSISEFELISLYCVYVGILWLTFRLGTRTPFVSIFHHSNTPTLIEESIPEKANISTMALMTKISDSEMPISDRLRSCSGLALLPARARRSVWTTQGS